MGTAEGHALDVLIAALIDRTVALLTTDFTALKEDLHQRGLDPAAFRRHLLSEPTAR